MRADKRRKGWWETRPSACLGKSAGELGFQDPHLMLLLQHHMNNEGFASPALRRSQLATALSKREIPATEAPFEPCNDLGPTCSSYLTRPWSRQEKYVVLFQVQPKIKFLRTYTTFVFEMLTVFSRKLDNFTQILTSTSSFINSPKGGADNH